MATPTTIKALPSFYNGYQFRSRLEARWAVFFDKMHEPYVYEPEGFDLGEAGWYLPDFWLPRLGVWVEIKPEMPATTDPAYAKAKQLAQQTRKQVWLVYGPCAKEVYEGSNIAVFYPDLPYRLISGWSACAKCSYLCNICEHMILNNPTMKDGVWINLPCGHQVKMSNNTGRKAIERALYAAERYRFVR